MSGCARLLGFVFLSALLLVGCRGGCQSPGDLQPAPEIVRSAPLEVGTNVETKPVVIEACLLVGTLSSTPPEPGYLPVEPALTAKLNKMGLRRTHYFLVSKTRFRAPSAVEQSRSLGDGCQVKVRSVNEGAFDVTVLRSGKPTARRTQSFRKHELLVISGDSPSGTSSWLVLLRRGE